MNSLTMPRIRANRWAGSLLALVVVLACMPSRAAVLMFDFGPTTPTGANLTNSPGHFTSAIPNTATTWNIMGLGDVSSGLLYGDNIAATGISLATGYETTNTSNIINFSLNPGSTNALGSAINTGIYAGDSVATDGIFQSTTAPIAVGVQIGGLAPGQYDVYISGRNTNVSGSYQQNFYGATSSATTTFDFNSLTAVPVANSGVVWAEGTTYARLTFTLGAGDFINLATEGTGINAAGRGFLNSLEIVSVPEPSTWALLGCGGLALAAMARRRKSSTNSKKAACV